MAASRKSAAEIRQTIRARIPGAEGEMLIRAFDGLNADVQVLATGLNTAIAAINAMGTKLNADAGVTDTDYDTAVAEVDIDL